MLVSFIGRRAARIGRSARKEVAYATHRASSRGLGPAGQVPGQARLHQDAGAGRGDRRGRVTAGGEPVRRATAPGPPAALRLPSGDGRGPRQLGRPQGPHARPVGTPRGVPRRGPPAGVLRLRGRHPRGRVRRRRRHRVGRRHLGPLLPARGPRPGRRGGPRRAPHGAGRPEAEGEVRPRPDVGGRRGQGELAAAAQEGRVRRGRMGRGGASAFGPVRPHQRRGQGRPRPPVALGSPGRGGRDRPPPADVRAGVSGRAPRPRPHRCGRSVGGVRSRRTADEPRQGPLPTTWAREAGHQTGPRAVCGADRPDPRPLPDAASAEHAPVPERRWYQRLLAQGAAQPCAVVADPLGQPGRRPGRDADVPRRRRAGGAGVGGELRRPGVARLDLAGRGPEPSDLRAGRPRPRRADHVARATGPRAAAPDGLRAPGRRRVAQADRPARHPDLGTDRDRPVVRRDPRVGRTGVADRGRRRPRAGQLEVAGPRALRAGPAGLHPERGQQDPGGALQPAGRCGGAVSAPIEWDELDDPRLRPDRYTIRTILRRLDERGDLFAPVLTTRQRLPPLH